MKKAIIAACLAFAAFAFAACGGQDGATPSSHTEGTDTAIEITGWAPYAGSHADMFLREGDRVAVISPSATPSRAQVDATVKGLAAWGYVPVEGKYVCVETRTLAQCLEDLEWALTDPDIKAIFCVRGGYAATEVMDALSLERVARAGKLIIGYSDITVYHSAWTVAGLPSIHSSMAAAFMDLPAECAEATRRLLAGEVPAYRCERTALSRDGEATGILIGGNLSTLTAVLGTAYDCTRTGQPYILVLEDVDEDLQHIHRFLTILDHLGVLDGASGLIFGEWVDVPASPGDYDGRDRGGAFASVADMISREFLADCTVPVAFGFPVGHGDVNYPLLMGETAHLTVDAEGITLNW